MYSFCYGRCYICKGERGMINIVNGILIYECFWNIDNRCFLGYWEGDLVLGIKNFYIVIFVDWKLCYMIIFRFRGKDFVLVN